MPTTGCTLLATLLCAALLWPTSTRAAPHAEITAYGELTAEREGPALQMPDDQTLSPRIVIQGITYVDTTTAIAAKLCLRFGVTIHLTPGPGEPLPTRLVSTITYPTLTRPDHVSSTQDTVSMPVLATSANDGTTMAAWTFDKPWELQPGEWTIAFLHDGHLLAAKTFTVTVPTPTQSVCPGHPTS